jgi:hypothetical protein
LFIELIFRVFKYHKNSDFAIHFQVSFGSSANKFSHYRLLPPPPPPPERDDPIEFDLDADEEE